MVQDTIHSQEAEIRALRAYAEVLEIDDYFFQKYNIPYDYLVLLRKECRRLELDLDFMIALMRIESNFDKNATSRKLARGLMQVQWTTAADVDSNLTSFWQLYDPRTNIRVGCEYFRQLLDRYEGSYRAAAISYNRGLTRYEEELSRGYIRDRYYRLIMGIVE